MMDDTMDKIILDLVGDAKSEDWAKVDEKISEIVKNKEYVAWAYNTALSDPDGNVRDLGVSILEKAVMTDKRFSDMRDRLYKKMISDNNPYVRFRSAFALAAHNPGRYKNEVLVVLKKALKDNDVKDFAKTYIEKLKEQ